MTTPYTLDYGTLYAHELRRFRIDSHASMKARTDRKRVLLGLFSTRLTTPLLGAASLATLTQLIV